jgi:hypothetical protein
MRNRARGLIIALTLVGLISAAAFARPSTAGQAPSRAKTYRLDWTFPVRVRGRVALHGRIAWLKVWASHWSVRASILNRSGHTLRPITVGKTGWGWFAETSGEKAHPVQCDWSVCRAANAASFRPALPRRLRPGAGWSGIFKGRGHPPRGWWLNFYLGYYYGLTPGGFGGGPGRLFHIP